MLALGRFMVGIRYVHNATMFRLPRCYVLEMEACFSQQAYLQAFILQMGHRDIRSDSCPDLPT